MDPEDSGASRPLTFREQHGATILGGILALMFILVLISQFAC